MESVFPFTVELENGTKRFADEDQLTQWLNELRTEYDWLPSSPAPADTLKNQMTKWTRIVEQRIQEAKEQILAEVSPVGTVSQAAEQIKQLLQGDNRFFEKGSPQLEFCKRIAEKDPLFAADVLWAMSRPNFAAIPDAPRQMRAMSAKTTYELGLADPDLEFPKASNELFDHANETLVKINNQSIDANERVELFKKRSTKRRLKQRNDFKELLAEKRAEWSDLLRAYDEKMALQSSVSYWAKKASEYSRSAYLFGVLTVIAASLFALVIGWWAVELFETIGEAKVTRWYQISVVAVYATIGIWILRILTRALMSNMHLKVDAEQRVTMVTTYLALLREGRALEEEDRRLIIEALFRPTQSGLVSGESGTQSMLEQFAALLARRNIK